MNSKISWMMLMLMLVGLAACRPQAMSPDTTSGKLIIFHAGSLTIPVEHLTRAFQQRYPDVVFETEASGSNVAARKVSELEREADLVLSADYVVLENLLIPDHAAWEIQFARNAMVIAYTERSLYADEITPDNWYEILLRDGVIYGHSEPDADPCGYRTLLLWQLAELYYAYPGLSQQLQAHCPPENIRSKSVALVALLQSGDMDYAWEYRSVALQHQLDFVELPDAINLGQAHYADFYQQASVAIAGDSPGSTMMMVGQPIIYGLTIPRNAPHPALAVAFAEFLLGEEGQRILSAVGQMPLVPPLSPQRDALPAPLKSLVP